MSRYIIYQAETMDAHGWEARKLVNGSNETFTAILAEHFDSADGLLPEVGHRLTEYVTVSESVDPQFPGASTHCREGDWEITRVESYTPELPMGHFELIVVCVCRYVPVESELVPLGKVTVSADSFGGDQAAYEEWKASELVSQ
ncbi:hypothetical protein N836_08770 [Leptolyngbya sp. Heron Island J]|uniref:hypothetical protein n=1 Tax=Leptolyngbya sp. Heron Island J TaxID=1385935 RepID=UPI0003B9AD6C|nr:hypothetical protein [Leptolyngbya sp. Heron Island J]ESA36063.1 hypothetical protein N836_08770 [Leptolyngbya sp. Heron Island J]